MRWLDLEEEVVDGFAGDAGDSVHVDAEADSAKEFHGFFDADESCVAECAEGAIDAVIEDAGVAFQQHAAGVVFVLNDVGQDDGLEFLEDFFFGAAEGYLIGDLVEIAGGFGAFAVVATDGEVEVFGGTADALDLVGHLERGQVHHDGEADAGADVGWAGGEVAPAREEGVIDATFDGVIDGVEAVVDLFQLRTGCEDLHAQVVFLVDHDAQGFIAGDCNGAAMIAFCEVLGDEVAFKEKATIAERGLAKVDPDHAGREFVVEKDGFCDAEEFLALRVAGAVDEGEASDVASHADAATKHDIVGWSVGCGVRVGGGVKHGRGEGRGQRSEIRGQTSEEVRGQRSERD